ncbi:MAG: cob(I)yrinic acid a,c-diamide adenosyltransferase [Puniceicoccales bacterium]
MKRSRVYTRAGDTGTCQLIGGSRVPKDDPRVECYGDYDEGCSFLGLLRVQLGMEHPWQERLQTMQKNLMTFMAVLASPESMRSKFVFESEKTDELESWIDELEHGLGSRSNSFLLPGGCESASLCHVIRTIFRRAERRMATVHREYPVPPAALSFGNRLSDFFFLFSRYELDRCQVPEEPWKTFH